MKHEAGAIWETILTVDDECVTGSQHHEGGYPLADSENRQMWNAMLGSELPPLVYDSDLDELRSKYVLKLYRVTEVDENGD